MNLKETEKYYKPDHTTFGGAVYNYDFEGYVSIGDMISRILSDRRFDKKCKENIKSKNRKKKELTNGN